MNGLIVVIGCLVGYAVFRHSKGSQPEAETKGDPAAAICVALAVATLLMFLFGAGGDLSEGGSEPSGHPSPSATAPR
ncbi:hypothetical protein OG562_45375 [Streptomyces sp. NBC_01275]|uniref:hypothetical protein n=1 Tax=Streptomyces sp. NBC_01275 TaxID=2903807 RepID=UPI00225BF3F6|nr:hypothetical protein [Streptomyces sp. NBC_01275]MCX4768038.1 hypothetical protein [Streptomyces sp. NBC_01275]